MSEAKLEEIVQTVDALSGKDPSALSAFLDEHRGWLRERGQQKLLAFGYFQAGQIAKSMRYLKIVPADNLNDEDRRTASQIRHRWRLEKRLRFGLYAPSEKLFSQRLIDGTANILRHGRLRNPTSIKAPGPRRLKAVSSQVRTLRNHDAGQLRALLDTHEVEYSAHGYEKFLAMNYYHAGCLSKAAAYLEALDVQSLTEKEMVFAANILFEKRAFDRLSAGKSPLHFETVAPARLSSEDRVRALYLAASSRPFIQSGYTSRSEAFVKTMGELEYFDLFPATRPGFPDDRSDAQTSKFPASEAGTFNCFPAKSSFRGDLEEYLEATLPALQDYVGNHGINLIHGVSNYRNGVIGLALARRLGLPFVYEVRGLWEETTDSKIVGWRGTERFELDRLFERYIVEASDGALIINEQVRDALDVEHVSNVAILPNCVAKASIVDRGSKPSVSHLRIGYIGSVLEYEGLDDLIHAIAKLQREGPDVRLDVYGKGADLQRLRHLRDELKVASVAFHGPVEPERVPNLYESVDLSVFPRKPHRVCQLVSPLKPLEAIANDVNIMVSDVAPLAVFTRNDAAVSFKAGSVESLAQQIADFAAMAEQERKVFRKRARDLLLSDFTWEMQGKSVLQVYREAGVRNQLRADPDAISSRDASGESHE